MAISVLNLRTFRSNGTSFPLSSYEEPFGTIEDRVVLPRQLLEQEGGSSSGTDLVKVIFFSFKHLDEILAQFFSQHAGTSSPPRVLNSRVISAKIIRRGGSGAAASPMPPPAQVVLRHLRAELASPTCVLWDTVAAAWSEAGCRVMAARALDTVCECHLPPGGEAAHFGLLMEEVGVGEGGGLVTTVVQLPAFHVEIIVASVAAGVLLILILLLLKVREVVRKVKSAVIKATILPQFTTNSSSGNRRFFISVTVPVQVPIPVPNILE